MPGSERAGPLGVGVRDGLALKKTSDGSQYMNQGVRWPRGTRLRRQGSVEVTVPHQSCFVVTLEMAWNAHPLQLSLCHSS